MERQKICVVITARASYSRIKTALEAIRDHEALELILVVAASALLDRYGSAAEIMEDDGFTIHSRVYNVVQGGTPTGQAKTTGLGIIELSNVFSNLQPDKVVTIADRYETMATAIAAAYMNIPLIHIQGGEVTGNIDEKVRHAITKLADLHLVSTAKAKERVEKMGEHPEKVIVTGCPSIDLAEHVAGCRTPEVPFNPYEKYGGVGQRPNYKKGYLVVLQHPVTTEYGLSRSHVEETLEAVNSLNMPTFWFWPNIDAGSDGTSSGIRAFRERNELPNLQFFKNMEPEDFLHVLRNAQCLIGNSSVAIRECSFLGVPAVNIGSRQSGRERGANVVEADYDRASIRAAIKQQLSSDRPERDALYGNGNAGLAIADRIANTPIQSDKKLAY